MAGFPNSYTELRMQSERCKMWHLQEAERGQNAQPGQNHYVLIKIHSEQVEGPRKGRTIQRGFTLRHQLLRGHAPEVKDMGISAAQEVSQR